MPSTTLSPTSSNYQATTGIGYDGVVKVNVGDYYGTGVLLSDGRTILTAAHIFDGNYSDINSVQVTFETQTQNKASVSPRRVSIHSDYNSRNVEADLALIYLEDWAFNDANRYTLFREEYEKNDSFTFVGYGAEGIGNTGTYTNLATPVRRMAENTIDGDADLLSTYLGSSLEWNPPAGTQFIADFDSGNAQNDAGGKLLDSIHVGLGAQEGIIAPGDSGGPAFIENKIAGIASYTASLSNNNSNPDVDDVNNSSFGEIAAWQNLAFYQEWIDKSLRSAYPDALTKPDEVKKSIIEGNDGIQYVYFLLNFTGIRSFEEEIISVDYTTRDGTAKAGEDYIAVEDTLNLYQDENQAVIAVEILGDEDIEDDEYFYLDVYNPVGGSFGDGVVKLTAVRTIIDDDAIYIYKKAEEKIR